eukprot:scaffold1870_cov104-Cylindrotheca_fusiformis.AAC.5
MKEQKPTDLIPLVDRKEEEEGEEDATARKAAVAAARARRQSRVIQQDIGDPETTAPHRVSVLLHPDIPAILDTSCFDSPEAEQQPIFRKTTSRQNSKPAHDDEAAARARRRASRGIHQRAASARTLSTLSEEDPTVRNTMRRQNSEPIMEATRNHELSSPYSSFSALPQVLEEGEENESDQEVAVKTEAEIEAEARARRRQSRGIHPRAQSAAVTPTNWWQGGEKRNGIHSRNLHRQYSEPTMKSPRNSGRKSARMRESVALHPDLPLLVEDDDEEGPSIVDSSEFGGKRFSFRQADFTPMLVQDDAAIVSRRSTRQRFSEPIIATNSRPRQYSVLVHPDLPPLSEQDLSSPVVHRPLPLLSGEDDLDLSESSGTTLGEDQGYVVANLRRKVIELEAKRRDMEHWYKSRIEKVKEADGKIIQQLKDERENKEAQQNSKDEQEEPHQLESIASDSGENDDAGIIQKLKGEKDELNMKLKEALESVDAIQKEFHEYRRSIVEDKLIIQQLKDERNALQSKLLQEKESRSMSEENMIIQQLEDERNELQSKLESHEGNMSDSLIIQQLKDERNQLQSRLAQTQDQAQEPESYEQKRSTNEDKLIIQQLKDERNDLRSQLEQVQPRQTEDAEAYERNRSILEDKLIIQQLKDERNELRSKWAEAERRAEEYSERESDQRNRSTTEDTLIIQQLKDERNDVRSKLVEAQERIEADASEHCRSATEDKLVIQQLKDERNRLRSQLATMEAHEEQSDEDFEYRLISMQQKHNQIVQELTQQYNALRAKLKQSNNNSNGNTQHKNGGDYSDVLHDPQGSVRSSDCTVATTSSFSKENASLAPSEGSSKLEELRAHKKSVESHLKTMAPMSVQSILGSAVEELETYKQVIADQKLQLKKFAARQRSHERIIAEQKIQIQLLTKKRKKQPNLADHSRAMYHRQLDDWKVVRLLRVLEAKYDALCDLCARKVNAFEREYDVNTHITPQTLPYIGGGLLVLAKLFLFFLQWSRSN